MNPPPASSNWFSLSTFPVIFSFPHLTQSAFWLIPLPRVQKFVRSPMSSPPNLSSPHPPLVPSHTSSWRFFIPPPSEQIFPLFTFLCCLLGPSPSHRTLTLSFFFSSRFDTNFLFIRIRPLIKVVVSVPNSFPDEVVLKLLICPSRKGGPRLPLFLMLFFQRFFYEKLLIFLCPLGQDGPFPLE